MVCCGMCDADLDAGGTVWVGLNRFVVGAGEHFQMLELAGAEGTEYAWVPQTNTVTAVALCWPRCALEWIEGHQIEHAVELRNDDEEQL